MKIKRAMSLAGFSLCTVWAAVQIGGCSSVPKPAEADGKARVPANDAARVQALQQRVNADRQLLSDNNLLRAQVDVLQSKLNEMTTIVREALMLPPAPRAQLAPAPAQTPLSAAPHSMAAPDMPAYAYSTNSSGVVIRVFHPFARTEFEPSDQVAQALRSSVRGAEQIEVRGHTDSNVVNPIDKLIAIERAEKARTWLINNGAEASKIRTKYFSAGNFLGENRTPQGRSVNRRVEIDIRNQQLASNHVATSN
jgi:outer membrane protein OmpA-like peptidoglycan-associated protein